MSIDEPAGRVVASVTIEGDVSPRVELTPAANVRLATLWAPEGLRFLIRSRRMEE